MNTSHFLDMILARIHKKKGCFQLKSDNSAKKTQLLKREESKGHTHHESPRFVTPTFLLGRV